MPIQVAFALPPHAPGEPCPVSGNRCSCSRHCNIQALEASAREKHEAKAEPGQEVVAWESLPGKLREELIHHEREAVEGAPERVKRSIAQLHLRDALYKLHHALRWGFGFPDVESLRILDFLGAGEYECALSEMTAWFSSLEKANT